MFLCLFIIIVLIVLARRQSVLAIYIAMTFMFPGFVRIYPIPVSLQLAFIFFLFLYTVCLGKWNNLFVKNNYYVSYFLIYFIGIKIVFSFLGTYMTFWEQLDINATLMSVIILLCWLHTERKSFEDLKNVLPYVLFLFMVYGILTSIITSNPYFEFINKFVGGEKDYLSISDRYSEEVRGGLTGRISVVTYNPLQYAILVDILFYFILYIYIETKHKKYIVLMGLMFLNVFLAGSRGPLVALLAPILLFLFFQMSGKQKLVFVSIVALLVLIVFFVPIFDRYSSYIKSFIFFFDESYSDAADIKGSSVSGRFEQLEGSIDLVLSTLDVKTILFGYGQGYTNLYLKTYGSSTSVLGFESEIFVTLVNHGVFGLITMFLGKYVLLGMILYSFYNKKKLDSSGLFVLKSMLFTNFVYSVLVGSVYEDLYLVMFFILLKISIEKRESMLKYFYYDNNKESKWKIYQIR